LEILDYLKYSLHGKVKSEFRYPKAGYHT